MSEPKKDHPNQDHYANLFARKDYRVGEVYRVMGKPKRDMNVWIIAAMACLIVLLGVLYRLTATP